MARTDSNKRSRIKHRPLSERRVDALLAMLGGNEGAELSRDDCDALHGVVQTWAHLTELAARENASILDVRKVLGISMRSSAGAKNNESPDAAEQRSDAPSDEALGDATDGEAADTDADEPGTELTASQQNRSSHGRRKDKDIGPLAHVEHHHPLLAAGDHCPCCHRGRVYKYRPHVYTSISGQAPLVATRHTQEVLQCNLCKQNFEAPLPPALQADGVGGRALYTYSAVAMVCVLRCFGGMPMHRQSRLQQALGVEVPDSSMWDMHERLAQALHPVWHHLKTLSRGAKLFYGDDTGAKILSRRTEVKANRRTGKTSVRTGTHTTGVIAVLPEGQQVILFATGIHHTGEVLDELLSERDEALAPPLFMGDGIESNTITTAPVLYAACNAHAVRRFKALTDSYPDYTDYVLQRYGQVYDHETHCRTNGLDDDARQQHHAEHSRPLMHEIREYGDDLIAHRKVEPNSDLGQAFEYHQNNYRRLTAFCRHPGAPIDNNHMERTLRVCVRLRETTKFFRNPMGARVADIILSAGATALAANGNLFDYFVAVQRYADDVREHPEQWVPWNYAERFRELSGTDPPNTKTPPLLSMN